jgi:hypothetical protein
MSIRKSLLAIAALAFVSPAAFASNDSRPAEPDRVTDSESSFTMKLADDAVTTSFLRLLNHEPNTVAPPVPANFERDPLIDALILPLLRSKAESRRRGRQID